MSRDVCFYRKQHLELTKNEKRANVTDSGPHVIATSFLYRGVHCDWSVRKCGGGHWLPLSSGSLMWETPIVEELEHAVPSYYQVPSAAYNNVDRV